MQDLSLHEISDIFLIFQILYDISDNAGWLLYLFYCFY